jgi:hypothetical protein
MSTSQVEEKAIQPEKPLAKTGPARETGRSRKSSQTIPRQVDLGTPAGRKTATAILEVLGGERSPTEAAEVLGVSLPRYYAIETRALAGFLAGCEPRAVGRYVAPEREVEKLRRENERLARESARHQALARAAARAVGLSAPPAKARKEKEGKGRKRRRPATRALKVAERMREKADVAVGRFPLDAPLPSAVGPLSAVSSANLSVTAPKEKTGAPMPA